MFYRGLGLRAALDLDRRLGSERRRRLGSVRGDGEHITTMRELAAGAAILGLDAAHGNLQIPQNRVSLQSKTQGGLANSSINDQLASRALCNTHLLVKVPRNTKFNEDKPDYSRIINLCQQLFQRFYRVIVANRFIWCTKEYRVTICFLKIGCYV